MPTPAQVLDALVTLVALYTQVAALLAVGAVAAVAVSTYRALQNAPGAEHESGGARTMRPGSSCDG